MTQPNDRALNQSYHLGELLQEVVNGSRNRTSRGLLPREHSHKPFKLDFATRSLTSSARAKEMQRMSFLTPKVARISELQFLERPRCSYKEQQKRRRLTFVSVCSRL
jgi:hypothetical protein